MYQQINRQSRVQPKKYELNSNQHTELKLTKVCNKYINTHLKKHTSAKTTYTWQVLQLRFHRIEIFHK